MTKTTKNSKSFGVSQDQQTIQDKPFFNEQCFDYEQNSIFATTPIAQLIQMPIANKTIVLRDKNFYSLINKNAKPFEKTIDKIHYKGLKSIIQKGKDKTLEIRFAYNLDTLEKIENKFYLLSEYIISEIQKRCYIDGKFKGPDPHFSIPLNETFDFLQLGKSQQNIYDLLDNLNAYNRGFYFNFITKDKTEKTNNAELIGAKGNSLFSVFTNKKDNNPTLEIEVFSGQLGEKINFWYLFFNQFIHIPTWTFSLNNLKSVFIISELFKHARRNHRIKATLQIANLLKAIGIDFESEDRIKKPNRILKEFQNAFEIITNNEKYKASKDFVLTFDTSIFEGRTRLKEFLQRTIQIEILNKQTQAEIINLNKERDLNIQRLINLKGKKEQSAQEDQK